MRCIKLRYVVALIWLPYYQYFEITLSQLDNNNTLMGAEQPKGPVQPEKTLKEQVKQYTKEIQKSRREFARQRYKIEYQGKNLNRELKKKIDKKQPAQVKKVLAQQILKNNQMLAKYDKLDAQLQNVQFELQQMAVNESMQNVMSGMANIMSGASNKMKSKDYAETMKRFMSEKERMNVLNEFVEDVMQTDDDEIEDEDVDKLINEMTHEAVVKKQKKVEVNNEIDLDDYENGLKDL